MESIYESKCCSFIRTKLDKINWKWLSRNPNAIHLLEQNQEKIDWEELSKNLNALHLLEQNLDKIELSWLSPNPKFVDLLEQKFLELEYDNIDIEPLLFNPNFFEIDYQFLEERIQSFKEELMQKCFHPDRLFYYLKTYNYDIGEDAYQD